MEILLLILLIGFVVVIILGVIGSLYASYEYRKALAMLRRVPPNTPQYDYWKKVAWEAGLRRHQLEMINDTKKESAIKQMIWAEIQANTRGY
jgi:hypothetical protein